MPQARWIYDVPRREAKPFQHIPSLPAFPPYNWMGGGQNHLNAAIHSTHSHALKRREIHKEFFSFKLPELTQGILAPKLCIGLVWHISVQAEHRKYTAPPPMVRGLHAFVSCRLQHLCHLWDPLVCNTETELL